MKSKDHYRHNWYRRWQINRRLPEWASIDKEGTIHVEPGIVYPKFLKLLGVVSDQQITQYNLEIARRCFTTYLKEVVQLPMRLKIHKNSLYKLSAWPEGLGAEAGANDFRKYYTFLKSKIES